MRPLAPLLPYVRPYRARFAWGAAAVAVGAVFGALAPVVVRRAVDSLAAGASWGAVGRYAGALVALAAVQGVFRYLQRRLVMGAAREVETDLRNALFQRLLRQAPAWFDRMPTGDVLSRFSNDLGAVRLAAGPGILFGLSTTATLVLAIGFMAWIDPVLTVWALLPLPFVSLSVRHMGQRIHVRSEAAQAALADVSTAVQEHLSGLRVVRAFGRESVERAAFGRRSEAYVRANLGVARLQAVLSPALGFLLGTSLLVLLFVGGRRVAAGSVTLGDFVAFTMYLGMIGWPLVAVGWITNLFQRASAAMVRLGEILLAEPAIDDRAADPAAVPGAGAISLRGVTFRYGPDRPVVLEDLDLDVPAGSTLGLTGPTGGGKTTLVGLIPRLHEPDAGRVELDGRPVAEYPLARLRAAIAVAPQEPFLFSAPLRENLQFAGDGGRLTVDEAAEIAGLETDLAALPEGIDTLVGERGVTLSGGQRQRAALARAILADPRILILDDAFSSVDTETEARILARLRSTMEERTTILVSHRASTLRHADRVVVLDGGRIVESGPPDELVAAGGWFAELDRRQRLEAEIERA